MYLICYSKTGDRETSKDIVQDIFKSLWNRRESLVIDGNIEHYLMRCLKFKIIDHFRKLSRQRDWQQISIIRPSEFANCTEEQVACRDLKHQLHKHIENLPDQCRKVFNMSREQGLTNKKIARLLAISERAVAYHIASALRFLRKKGISQSIDI